MHKINNVMAALRAKAVSVCVMFALCIAGPADAKIVFDPTNFAMNIIDALEAIKATADRAVQIKVQYEQYATQLQQLKNLDPQALARMLANNSKQVADLQKYIETAERMYGSVQQVRKVMQGKFDAAKLAKLPFKEYMEVLRKQVESGAKDAIDRAENDRKTLERVKDDYQEVMEWQEKIGKTEGLHQAQQLMNSQVSRLVTQNAEIIKMMATTRLEQNRDQVDKLTEQENARLAAEKMESDRNAASVRARESLDRWKIK